MLGLLILACLVISAVVVARLYRRDDTYKPNQIYSPYDKTILQVLEASINFQTAIPDLKTRQSKLLSDIAAITNSNSDITYRIKNRLSELGQQTMTPPILPPVDVDSELILLNSAGESINTLKTDYNDQVGPNDPFVDLSNRSLTSTFYINLLSIATGYMNSTSLTLTEFNTKYNSNPIYDNSISLRTHLEEMANSTTVYNLSLIGSDMDAINLQQ